MGNRTVRSCAATLFVVVLCFAGFALAQEVVTKLDVDPGTFAQDMYTAFTAKEWSIFVGCLIMLAVWFTRLFLLPRLPAEWLSYVSSGTGVLLSISVDLTSKVPWWKAVLNGLLVGAAASGLWSQIGKKVLPSERKKKENIEVAKPEPVNVYDAPTTPKIIILKKEAFRDSKLDETAVIDEEVVKRLLRDDEITEPERKVVAPDDPKPSS